VAAFSLSVVAAALFLRCQAGATDAVVPLSMLRHCAFAACLAVATAVNFGAHAMLFLTSSISKPRAALRHWMLPSCCCRCP
jgi:hypothetical protein